MNFKCTPVEVENNDGLLLALIHFVFLYRIHCENRIHARVSANENIRCAFCVHK